MITCLLHEQPRMPIARSTIVPSRKPLYGNKLLKRQGV